jgi:hypothetical protein
VVAFSSMDIFVAEVDKEATVEVSRNFMLKIVHIRDASLWEAPSQSESLQVYSYSKIPRWFPYFRRAARLEQY